MEIHTRTKGLRDEWIKKSLMENLALPADARPRLPMTRWLLLGYQPKRHARLSEPPETYLELLLARGVAQHAKERGEVADPNGDEE